MAQIFPSGISIWMSETNPSRWPELMQMTSLHCRSVNRMDMAVSSLRFWIRLCSGICFYDTLTDFRMAVMAPFSLRGTLKSTRIIARLPAKLKVSMVFIVVLILCKVNCFQILVRQPLQLAHITPQSYKHLPENQPFGRFFCLAH